MLDESGSDEAKSSFETWKEAGVYLSHDIRSGITSMASRIKQDAISVKSVQFRLHGLSTPLSESVKILYVLRSRFGWWYRGIREDSWKKAGSVGRAVVDSTKSLLTNLDSGMFDYIGPNPAIRPVIDLSRIQTGADSMHALFARNPMMSAGFFSESSFARGDNWLTFGSAKIVGGNDNHYVVNELHILTDRFDDLGKAVANMKITLDFRTLIGRTSAKMDNLLAQSLCEITEVICHFWLTAWKPFCKITLLS